MNVVLICFWNGFDLEKIKEKGETVVVCVRSENFSNWKNQKVPRTRVTQLIQE